MDSAARRDTAQTWLQDGHVAGLVGASPAGRSIVRSVLRLSGASGAVLVRGPAGSGKMAVARALHRLSAAERPWTLAHDASDLQSQAPTAGTLVIPDVESWDEPSQHELIRQLDRGTGARLVALSREPANASSLKPELVHRLSLNAITLPPLRERGPDVELLALHHLSRLPPDADGQPWHLTTEAVLALRRHDWPGNVRELFQTLERAAMRASLTPIRSAHLGLAAPAPPLVQATLAELERRAIEAALERFDGNVTEAGRALGVPRSTLYRKLKHWGLVGGARQG